MNEVNIEELERLHAKYEAREKVMDLLMMPVVMLSLGALSFLTFRQNSLPIFVMFLPLMPLIGILFAMKASTGRIQRVRSEISAYYQGQFMKTRWRTAANAEGVVIGVSTFGDTLTLAFENGVKESYARNSLTAV